ncbi:LysR substrate binding domain-containing protein [Raineyella antarctica]|uniref:LysR substrate binding domain-containing protein n=1 Tax=Raineyella antarctica TaxID=1577474 RepID=A0A1G6GF05_9ACTN|nr:LysR substrate-binding domain-containing protein [Raineyella antarctica]SDB80325.1 LysR substrate binding domain-containing protein [Raineyella antarctica]
MSGVPAEAVSAFRIAFVPGVSPDTWARKWRDRVRRVPLELLPVPDEDQLAVLLEGRADMALLRLPVDHEGLNVIPLYEEVPVVVVPKDHPASVFDEVSVTDLADEHLLQDPDEVPSWRDVAAEVADGSRFPVPPMTMAQAFETVGAGTGILIVPMSLARLHQRKDVVARPVTGVEPSRVGLAWLADHADERTEYFIGIVRGRTANTSRSDVPGQTPRSGTPKGGTGTRAARTTGAARKQRGPRRTGRR